ncbi:MAG: DUF4238 domain-containing protein [Pseudomonadota bacterium]
MSDPKRHHHTPEAYLKHFVEDDGCVSCVNLNGLKRFQTAPKNVGVIGHFNTVKFEDGSVDQTTLEQFYSTFETQYNDWLEEAKTPPVSQRAVEFFIQFASIQRMRSPGARKILGPLTLLLLKDPKYRELQSELTEEEAALVSRAQCNDSEAIDQIGMRLSGQLGIATASQLDEMEFVFLVTSGTKQLITCDNPVFICGLQVSGKKASITLPVPNQRKILLFPLSKSVLLYGDTATKSEIGFHTYNKRATCTSGISKRVNQILSAQATDQIYADLERHSYLHLNAKGLRPANLQQFENGLLSKWVNEAFRLIQHQLYAAH